jgi:hypothetical protein
MSLVIHCDRCGNELNQFGGLLFSPPGSDGRPEKRHLCVDCYAVVFAELRDHPADPGCEWHVRRERFLEQCIEQHKLRIDSLEQQLRTAVQRCGYRNER